MKWFFDRLWGTKSNAQATRLHHRVWQPKLEALENRCLMAAGIFSIPSSTDGRLVVWGVGTTSADRMIVTPFIAYQQLASRQGSITIQVPKVEIRITDAAGAMRYDAAGTPRIQAFEQAKVGSLTLYGDKGDDIITNDSSIPSHLVGEGGSDILYGGSGDDTIGGDGNAAAADGQNKLYGRGGNDHLEGGNLNDKLFGGLGDDELNGHGGDDSLYGEAGLDTLFGGNGKDYLFGGLNDDELWGGIGDDLLIGDGGNDLLVGAAGSDTLRGGSGDDTLMGGFRHFNAAVAILGPVDSVYSQTDDGSADHLWGGDGQDRVYYRLNQDWIDGWWQVSAVTTDYIMGPEKDRIT